MSKAIELADAAAKAAYAKELAECVAAGMDADEAAEWALDASMDAFDAALA